MVIKSNQQFEHGEGRAGFWHCFGKKNLRNRAAKRGLEQESNLMQFMGNFVQLGKKVEKSWNVFDTTEVKELPKYKLYIIIIIIIIIIYYYLLLLLYLYNHNMYHYSS